MISATRSFAAFALMMLVGCSAESSPPTTLEGQPSATDSRSTSELVSDQGRLIVLFDVAEGANPSAPVMLSFDGRPPEAIQLPRGPKNYDLPPGGHSARVSLDQATCTVFGVPANIDTSYFGRFDMLPNTTHYFQVSVDCSSVSTRSGAKMTTTGTNVPESFLLRVWSSTVPSRQVELPANGSVNFGPIPVGWYHAEVSRVPANCRVAGVGAPLPPGSFGVDTFMVAANGSAVHYSGICN